LYFMLDKFEYLHILLRLGNGKLECPECR